MREISICHECYRIVATRLLLNTAIGNIVVPVQHRNEEGEECDGSNSEAIVAWDRIDPLSTQPTEAGG